MCQNTLFFFNAHYLQVFLAAKNASLVINRARGFTAIALCSCSRAIAELAADSVTQARDFSCFLQHCYTRGTILPLFWSDGCTTLSKQAVVPRTTGPLLTSAEQVKHARLSLALFEDKQA